MGDHAGILGAVVFVSFCHFFCWWWEGVERAGGDLARFRELPGQPVQIGIPLRHPTWFPVSFTTYLTLGFLLFWGAERLLQLGFPPLQIALHYRLGQAVGRTGVDLQRRPLYQRCSRDARRFDRVTAYDVSLRDRKLAFHVGEGPPRVTRYFAESP